MKINSLHIESNYGDGKNRPESYVLAYYSNYAMICTSLFHTIVLYIQ